MTFDGHFDYEDIDIRKKFYHFSRATGYQLSTVQILLRSVRYLCVPPLVNNKLNLIAKITNLAEIL